MPPPSPQETENPVVLSASLVFGETMNPVTIHSKKYLDFAALRQALSTHLLTIEDPRATARCTHTLHDSLMSAFACMYFQDSSLSLSLSLSQFQLRMQEHENRSNLTNLFQVETIPKDSQLRRSKHMESFQILPEQYLCAIDGVHYHFSENIHCNQCLIKRMPTNRWPTIMACSKALLCTRIKSRWPPVHDAVDCRLWCVA